jgi:hypothetical protein
MDHSEAVRLHAAEKYVLGELPPTLRDQYEEHFFDCQECAADVRTAVAFAVTSRAALRSMPREDEGVSVQGGFAARFFQPLWTVPAMALLLVALTYQTFIAIPSLKNSVPSVTLGSANFISLIGANSRAEGTKSFSLASGKPLILEVDIPASDQYTAYQCQLRDPSGRLVLDSAISSAEARNTVHLIVPGTQLQSGSYGLSVLGRTSANSSPAEVLQSKFTIQVTQ